MKLFYSFLLLSTFVFGQAGFVEREFRYRLQAEDKVEIQYRYTPEYNATAAVQPDGFVSLPLIGEVKLAGLTLEEATVAVHAKACEQLNEPQVVVLLKEYVKPYFVIAGEVAHPGRIDLHGDVSLVEAIALGGGFRDSAHRTQVILLRKAGAEQARVSVIDARKLMTSGGIKEDIRIHPGDLVVVPRNALSKIEPYIRMTESGLYGIALRML
jgi:polysaccharide biosynthesis/export protein